MKHNEFMQIAIKAAQKSCNDVPVGAIIIKDGQIISKACNKKEKTNDISAHAEILALKKAAKILNNWRLEGCIMYVTLEPCPMCAAAIINSRISEVYFGANDTLYGALGSAIDLRKLFNSKLKVKGGILEKECEDLLKNFWRKDGKSKNKVG